MRRGAMIVVRAGLLAGPTVLAFASGGFFTGARLTAAIAAWALLALAVLAVPAPVLPAGRPARTALAALALLGAWTALSTTWAPAHGPARDAVERVLLYLPALAAGSIAWREREAARWVEPALAAGALLVIGYGLAGRLVPSVVHLHASARAGGRLEQPLTYWNAMGALAAIGLILCARLGGDPTRPVRLRLAAAAAAAPLGMGLYLSFSRGALAAFGCALVVLVLLVPTWAQLRAAAITLEAGVLGALVCAPFGAVRALHEGSRNAQGAAVLALLLAAMAFSAWLAHLSCREDAQGGGALDFGRGRRIALVALAAALALAPYAAALGERGNGASQASFGATSARFTDVGSSRYAYWRVAVDTFAAAPLKGVGAGGYATEWLRRRTIAERVRDAHSLYLQTLAELGIVGFALLAVLIGAVVVAARRALRADRALAAGPAAGALVWALHAGLDWDWQMPALTLVAVALAGLLLCRSAPA
ncbi:MAG TPA: O-antigen ligase family protein [Solirubrobacteraceae bacterium]|nr:O-antigen ligase family protein [Solirubrobacteraceae bacterium]